MIYKKYIYHFEKPWGVQELGPFGSIGVHGAESGGCGYCIGTPYWYDIAEYAMDRSRRSTGMPVPGDCIQCFEF